MNYEQAIFNVLLEAGDKGLSVKNIAHHVHNSVNTFFNHVDYEVVYAEVRRYIYKNSRNSYSVLEHTAEWGCYRLNKNSEKYMQLQLFQ